MAMHAGRGLRWQVRAAALLFISSLLASTGAFAAVCRVAVDGVAGNDGVSWTTPKDLHGALADAGCSELWLKQGVYKPVTTTTPPTTAERGIAFQISRDLLLYGGFADTEDTLGERDPVAHRTVLSGDIQGDDTDPDGNGIIESSADIVGGNSYHVVTMGGQDGSSVTAATLLDGITITAGQAFAAGSMPPYGGGLLCWTYAPNSVCSPRLNDVDFRGNFAAQNGGGMMAWAGGKDSDSSPGLTRVRFSGNYGRGGGGMANRTSGSGNSANHLNRSSPSLVDVSFIGNSGPNGAGMLSQASGDYATVSPTLRRVTFSGNTATDGDGGGMYVDAHGLHAIVDPVLSEVTFSNNSAFQSGGALFFELSNALTGELELHPVLRHVTFANNSASRGGAVANDNLGGNNNFSPTFSHVVFSGNHANVDDDFNFDWVNNAFFEYTIMAGGCVPMDDGHRIITCGDGNSTADPLLGPLQDNGGFTQTHEPAPDSPAIDSGDPAQCDGVDQRGVPRPQGARCDIGAVEVQVWTLGVAVVGDGQVDAAAAPHSGSTIAACTGGGGSCTGGYYDHGAIELTATPIDDESFVAWGGDCSGTSPTVMVAMTQDRHCTAQFTGGDRIFANGFDATP